MIKIESVDIISTIILVGAGYLLFKGIDTVVAMVVTAVVGYYYGHKRKQENSKKV